jgi:hypothetical protein
VVEDCDAGIKGFEGSRGGVAALGFRDLAGLMDLRNGSGEMGTGVLDLGGSSTMYMGVSISRNSTSEGQCTSQLSSNA